MKNRYTFSEKLRLAYCLLWTKFFYKRARLIRLPFDIRGVNNIDLGVGLTTGRCCRLETFSNTNRIMLKFGANVQLNDYVHISAMEYVEIGDNVLMASHIYISDNSHGLYKGSQYDSSPCIAPIDREYLSKPVKIGNNVWLSEHVVVLPGISIGDGAIIGANSVVSKDIPSNTIAVGSPAVPIKRYNFKTNKWERI